MGQIIPGVFGERSDANAGFVLGGDKNFSATRPCGSIGIGGRKSSMKCCLSSSGCETRPAKGEPARPVASLAPFVETRAAMRRQAKRAGRGTAAPKPIVFPDAERAGIHRRQQWPSACSGRGGGCIRRGVRPQHVRRGWPRNLGDTMLVR